MPKNYRYSSQGAGYKIMPQGTSRPSLGLKDYTTGSHVPTLSE